MSDREIKALALWKKWFYEDGDPWVSISEYAGGTVVYDVCFFCGGDRPDHAPDCVFVQAQKLVKE